eukprot:scaffold20415_cov42-Attheya_sp.AAC.1
MGMDAKWFMVNEFTDSSNIQNLLETQQQSLQPFLNTAAEAVEMNNPCDKVATNSDIFVLCLSMGLAACGGINAVLASVHLALHVMYLFFRKRPTKEKGRTVPPLRLLPTYEVIFVTFGGCVFVALFVPVYLQVAREMEIANFRTSAADMEIHYAQREPLLLGKSALVTLVQTETWCENARPDLLKYLFIGGLILGSLINIPFVYVSVIVWARYLKRILKPEAELPKDCTIYDRHLRILRGIEPGDDNDITTGDQSTAFIQSKSPDIKIKLLIVGEPGVGRTCLLLRYTNEFSLLHARADINFKLKKTTIDNKNIEMQIWDNIGKGHFGAITNSCFRDAQGILVVYDVTNRRSFESIPFWISQIEQHANNGVKKTLVGTKCDLIDEKVVSTEEGESLAKRLGIAFIESSAKNNVNVDACFISIAKSVMRYNETRTVVVDVDDDDDDDDEAMGTA